MKKSGNAAMHSKYASHTSWVNAFDHTLYQTGQLSVPVHMQALMFFIQPVQWAKQVASGGLCHMKVHQGGFNAFMTQKFLDRYDIHTELQQMRGITMAECVQGDSFLQMAFLYGFAQCPLHTANAKRRAWAAAVEQYNLPAGRHSSTCAGLQVSAGRVERTHPCCTCSDGCGSSCARSLCRRRVTGLLRVHVRPDTSTADTRGRLPVQKLIFDQINISYMIDNKLNNIIHLIDFFSFCAD